VSHYKLADSRCQNLIQKRLAQTLLQWCATVEKILNEIPLQGSALILALSMSLEGMVVADLLSRDHVATIQTTVRTAI